MAVTESLESELRDYALLAACVGGGVALAAGRSASGLTTAATAGRLDGAAVAAYHASAAAPHAFEAFSGPEVKARLGVEAVAGVHWVGADGTLAGGVFVLEQKVSRESAAALTALGRRLAAQLRLREAVARHREPLADTDGLTGLLNRHGFEAALAAEWQRARRAGAPVALLLFEVDGLGRLAAARGREAGEAALRRVASCLHGCVSRAGDVVARFGEDVFGIVLAVDKGGQAGAAQVAEKCRAAVERLGLADGKGDVLTVSCGAVTMVAEAAEPARLLQRADSALYMAKDRGGNRVCAFAPREREVSGAF